MKNKTFVLFVTFVVNPVFVSFAIGVALLPVLTSRFWRSGSAYPRLPRLAHRTANLI
jgi:hypothetical protein